MSDALGRFIVALDAERPDLPVRMLIAHPWLFGELRKDPRFPKEITWTPDIEPAYVRCSGYLGMTQGVAVFQSTDIPQDAIVRVL